MSEDQLPEGFEPLKSENIKAIRKIYCGIHGRVELQLLFRNPAPGGSRYHYQDVLAREVDALKSADSPTAYLNARIKPHYHCYRAIIETGRPWNAA